MSSGQAPNVVFVFSDQMRGMDMGCAGNDEVLTPNMDRLAAEGTRFTHAYANTPVCTPSRASLLTGRYPLSHRVIANDLPLPEDMPTVGEAFREGGWRTGYIGKWHLDGVPRTKWTPPGQRRHGFDYWAVYNCSHEYFRDDKYYVDSPEPVRAEGYEPKVQTDLALEFIVAQSEQPFCLFLSWGPPHDPYPQVPEEYKKLYDPARVTLPSNVQDISEDENPLSTGLEPRETLANYYAAITALDEQLGRIMDQLEALGLSERTILIYTSDHGDMLWSQGKMKKQQPWEESINIPLIVRWPGRIPEGKANDSLISVVDFAPTLLGLADLDQLPGSEGENLSTLILGQTTPIPKSVFIMDLVSTGESARQGLPEWRGVRTERYTYARLQNGEGWLLYDNLEDPYQCTNHIEESEFAEVREDLDRTLDGWMNFAGDSSLPGREYVRRLGLTDLWNEGQLEPHVSSPEFL